MPWDKKVDFAIFTLNLWKYYLWKYCHPYLWTEANFCNICQICKCDTRHQQVMFIVFICDIVYTLHMNCKSWLSFFPFFLIQCWQPSLLFVWTIVVQNFNDKWSKVNYDNLLYCTLMVTIFYSFWPVVVKMVDRSGYKIKDEDESGSLTLVGSG